MSLAYPRENRIYEDEKNVNDRLYRESESHAKVYHADKNLREDFGFEKKIYENVHDPNDAFQEIQGKLYRSE